jgi:DNA polymerase III subunit beta
MTTATARRRKTTGITISRSTLLGLLKDAHAVVPARSPKPILTNVLIRDGLLIANDLEVQISCGIDWQHEPLLLPHARLRAILDSATGDEVTLVPDGTACTVKVGRGEWRLPVEDPAEFPISEPADLDSVCRIPCDQFKRAVGSVAYAADTESNRFALGAVLVQIEGDKCHFVATDGRRLGVATVEHDQAVDDRQVLVPERAMILMANVAAKAENEDAAVQLLVSKTELVAEIGTTTITARLTEGRFPRWQDVIPEREASDMHTADLATLLSATRAAAIVTTETSKGVDYSFTTNGITLHGQSSESGESTVECDLMAAGTPGKVRLDPRYVADACKALSGLGEPHVRISVAGPGDAVLIVTGEDDEYRTVIMPLAND